MKIYIKTFGCRSNIYDSEIMKATLKGSLVDSEDEADLIIINSCTVTNFADRDLRRYINSLSDKEIILTGCAAYTRGEELFNQKKVKSVLGHKFKEEIDRYLDFKGIELGDFNFKTSKIVESISKSKAFIKIQEGCNFECGYCIIPSVRGASRSMDEDLIINQISTLAQNGIKEIVLTGINMGSYGEDTNTTLAKLIKRIENIRGIKRIRLGSLEPSQVDDELIELAVGSKLEKHLHIALQHTSDEMLRIMKRRNRVKPTLRLFERLAKKGIALGSDIIVGHPGESKKIWEEALANFKLFPLTHAHIFRFTPKDGTYSATLKNDIRGDEVKKRAKILDDIIKENNYNFRIKQKELFVHIENYKNGYYEGYDEFYNKMRIKSSKDIKGDWILVEDYEVRKDLNYAQL